MREVVALHSERASTKNRQIPIKDMVSVLKKNPANFGASKAIKRFSQRSEYSLSGHCAGENRALVKAK